MPTAMWPHTRSIQSVFPFWKQIYRVRLIILCKVLWEDSHNCPASLGLICVCRIIWEYLATWDKSSRLTLYKIAYHSVCDSPRRKWGLPFLSVSPASHPFPELKWVLYREIQSRVVFSPRNRFILSSVSWSVYSRSTTGGHAMTSVDIGVPHGCFNCGMILYHMCDIFASVFSRCSHSYWKQEP